MRLGRWAVTFVVWVPALGAQERGLGAIASEKSAVAVRVTNGAIQVDGTLGEETWAVATAITDFVQKEPVEGASPTERMEIRFVYDDEALYVGARMYSADPSAIQAPLGRRDGVDTTAEHVLVSFDTFLDRRTAYTFGVSASGVRFERFHASDDEATADSGFDPVWEARTRIDELGWTAELWIPFTQLRFNDRDEQLWGLNIRRFTPTLEEEVYWVMVPRTERAWASRFGELHGIEGVRPRRRIEVLPFVVGSSTINGKRDLRDPFDDGRNLASRAGVDLKIGVGPNLTLDATVNPDFGQVEADPAEVNLTAFATRFPEVRPFFAEGSDLLHLRHIANPDNVFYSRRIGAPPAGRASGDFVDRPSTSRILGAAKLTGRLPSGTSIGILAALTGQEFARVAEVDSQTTMSKVRVGPRTGYGVVKVQQEVGQPGSNASLFFGAVQRDVDEGDPLSSLLSRRALVIGTDALLRFNGGQYEWLWALVGSRVDGEPAAIAEIQRSSAHYFQRPDRTDQRIDPTQGSLTGVSMSTNFNRVGGRHWLFTTSIKIDAPTLETNDLASLNRADGIQPSASLTYRETQPGSLFRGYSIHLNQSNEWNFGWDRQSGQVGARVNVTWLNFSTTTVSLSRDLRIQSAYLTRGGPLMGGPAGWRASVTVGNSPTAQTRWSGTAAASTNELRGRSTSVNLNLSVRPGLRWQLSVRPSYVRSTEPQQYVTSLGGGRPETFGTRYIFAYIERSTFSAEFRLSFTLRPDLNLDIYAEPFAASGRYYDYGELLAPGSRERITYGTAGTSIQTEPDGSRTVSAGGPGFNLANLDFNRRTFNSNVVVRWEWRPGSTLYLVWQQSRDQQEALGSRVDLNDVFGSLTARGTNILLFKASFWLPIG